MTTQPQPGDIVLHDADTRDTWVRGADGALTDITRETVVDATEAGSFTVSGKRAHPVAPEPWQVICEDDAESTPRYRSGKVQAWAYLHEQADALKAFGGLA